MQDMTTPGNALFLQIQNSKKPEQIISLVLNEADGRFETQGLKLHFGVEEIVIERNDFLQWMEEYAQVISFLLETMSAAQDLNLPYGYQDRFEFRGQDYLLSSYNGYRLLQRNE